MDVLMPQLGETVAEGKITKWFKSAGDEVKPGDNLFEIETDKVSMEVPSTTTGVLAEIRVPAGAVALARKLMRGNLDEVLQRVDTEAMYFKERLQSDEARAAFAAFLTRKK